jgi:hypothetical protein
MEMAMATRIFSSFYFVTLSSTCIVAAAEAFSPSRLSFLPFSSLAHVNNTIKKYPTKTSNTATSLHMTCSHSRSGAIMMKSSTSKNDAKEQDDDESLLLHKDLDSLKFFYRAAFFSILVKIFTEGPLQNPFQSLTTTLDFILDSSILGFWIGTWQISRTYAKEADEMMTNQDVLNLTNTVSHLVQCLYSLDVGYNCSINITQGTWS